MTEGVAGGGVNEDICFVLGRLHRPQTDKGDLCCVYVCVCVAGRGDTEEEVVRSWIVCA